LIFLQHLLRPSGKKAEEESLYGWIISDFGLNDSIESGLVKNAESGYPG